ncbi:putative RNA-directed DNA polymerase [Tanacetum coccineum]
MAIMISSLDQSNPLHLHPNDSNCASIVNIKLTGVENYRVWASAVKLALQIKNKMGFLTGSCLRSDYVASRPLLKQWALGVRPVWNELKETYDRIDGSIVFNMLQKINSFKQGGLPVSEYYHKLNSLWREFDILTKLPDCTCEARAEIIDHAKDAFLIISREESHRGIPASSVKSENASSVKNEKPQVSAFVSRFNDNNKKRNTGSWSIGNNDTRGGFVSNADGKTSVSPVSFSNEQMLKLMSLLNDKSSTIANANMAGTNQHMTNSVKNMFNLVDVSGLKLTVGHPNGTLAKITHVGNLKLNNDVILFDVLVVPDYTVSLLSVNKLIKDSKLNVSFDESNCYIQDLKKGKVLGTGSLNLNHIKHDLPCEVCHKAKQSREPFPFSETKSTILGQLIHLDVWGPYKVVSGEGFRYFLTIDDDFYMLKTKDEVFQMFVSFNTLVLTQFDKKVKIVRSDNGTEFTNHKMSEFFNEMGILHQTTCAYTPQQNGIAERKHRHLLNVARSLMFQGGIPLQFWSDCVLTAVYLINRLPSSVLNGKSPFSIVYNREPNLSHLRSFGCLCYATIVKESDKFSNKSEKCVLIGYASNKKAYKLLSLDNRNVFYSRDVKFYETIFPYKMNKSDNFEKDFVSGVTDLIFFDNFESQIASKVSSPNDDEEGSPSGRDGRLHQPDPMSDNQSGSDAMLHQPGDDIVALQPGYDELQSATPVDETNSSEGNVGINPEVPVFQNILENQNEEVNLRRSSRISKLPARLNDYVLNNTVRYGLNKYVNHSMLSAKNCVFVSSLNKSCEPSSFEEASKDVNWINAMNNEMHALYENNTWELVDLPYGRKPIGSRWVYKIKYMSTGEIERYKARVVAKGYNQKEGIDYEETFSPVVKMSTVRCLIDLAVQRDWKLYQMDVNNAFLYGDLYEDVYMIPPPGFMDKNDNRVCKLKRSLYGLKQAPRQWNHKLYDTLLEAGFEQSKNDHSLYIKNDNNVSLFLLVYVDDLVITGNSEVEIHKFKTFLNKRFKMKDLGELKYFLGIEVLKTKTGLCLNQRKYCLELLHEFGLLACRPVLTPLPENIVLAHKETKDDKYLKNITSYQKLVGKLIYLCMTRPDISYSVHCLSQHMHAPLQSHFNLALRLLRYLKLAPGSGIDFSKNNSGIQVVAYSDSDWAKCPMTRRSVSGYCVFVNKNLVSWKSKKQPTLSKSSAEAEYRAMAATTCEAMWIVKILKDLGLKDLLPVELHCDNKAAIQIAANPVMHEKTKHFDLDVHFVREKVASGLIKTVKVDTKCQVAVYVYRFGSFQHNVLVKRAIMRERVVEPENERAESIVKDEGSKAFSQNKGLAAGLVRLHFHDCFVRGCDGSILIDSTSSNTAEKDSPANNPSLRGFNVIDNAKTRLEKVCPGVVSCADIVTFAARGGFQITGGLEYDVPAGRRDGRVSLITETTGLPPLTSNLNQLTYSSTKQDPTLDKLYASKLKQQCPKGSNNVNLVVPMNLSSPSISDTGYYVDVLNNKGLFTSDQSLLTSKSTANQVHQNAKDPYLLKSKFAKAMVQMGKNGVLTGSQGEIQKNYRVINKCKLKNKQENLELHVPGRTRV